MRSRRYLVIWTDGQFVCTVCSVVCMASYQSCVLFMLPMSSKWPMRDNINSTDSINDRSSDTKRLTSVPGSAQYLYLLTRFR